MKDPNQLFVISTISRQEIARLLSEIGGLEIAEDDDRLTDDFCKRFAEEMYAAECEHQDATNYETMAFESLEALVERQAEML